MTDTSSLPPIRLGSPGEDIQPRDLNAVKLRFKHLHRIREQRTQFFLLPKQRIFLDILPLLFHYNHPLLPGFTSTETPAGICDYTPDNRAILAAKKFSKKFPRQPKAIRNVAIEGLFLMGSVGSVAFSKASDLDIWLCHSPKLASLELNELQHKIGLVEKWAAELGLEVHFFLMDSEKFRQGKTSPLSSESSGETQHYLLLEEFYRTSIYLAGKVPAWWLVPPHQEYNYTEYVKHLQDNRFVGEYDLIDFGGLAHVPAEEFISATTWQLYKAISSPHKSILKLFLMECYASEFPKPQWLAFTIKQSVYEGSLTTVDLDPYYLIYQRVDSYLKAAGSSNRLNLVRKCFYLKTADAFTTVTDNETYNFRAHYLKEVAKRHQWPETLLDEFKQVKSWNIGNAVHENAVIIQQLGHCYRMIKGFANTYIQEQRKDNQDLKLISRKLHSFLDKKPSKVERISTGSAIHSLETEVSIVETGDYQWSLFTGKVDLTNHSNHNPVKSCRSLPEILVWAVINGLYHKRLQLHLASDTLKTSDDALHATLTHIRQFLNNNGPDDSSLLPYLSSNIPQAFMLMINLDMTATDVKEDGSHIISERSDPISYGVARHCFIESIDRLTVSAWGELTLANYRGILGLFECLADIINNHGQLLSGTNFSLDCHTLARGDSIIRRINNVFNNLLKIYGQSGEHLNPRYILPAGSNYCVFERKQQSLSFKLAADDTGLMQELASPQPYFSAVFFDAHVLENTPIPLLYRYNKAQTIQFFYLAQKNGIQIYVIDEKGSLHSRFHSKCSSDHLLRNYAIFLQNRLYRNMPETKLTINYFEIIKNSAGVLSLNNVQPDLDEFDDPKLNIRISGSFINNAIAYTIYCNDREFSYLDHGTKVFQAVYEYVLAFRTSKQDYPVHITDLDLPLAAFHVGSPLQLQTQHYLSYKQKIEAKLA